MNCPFCQSKTFEYDSGKDFKRHFCDNGHNHTMLDVGQDGQVIRYHITLDNEYSIRVSHKTNTIRIYFQKDKHGITPALLTLDAVNPDITPANAPEKIKTYLLFS